MAIIRKSLSAQNEQPLTASADGRSGLKHWSDREIDMAAASDPDALPATDEALDRAVAGRRVRRIREKAGLDQVGFAAKYRIELDLLRDIEEGRIMAKSAYLAYLAVIEREPDAVDRALDAGASAV